MVELGGKIECPICDWDWELESDDDRPHLCHKCGYDSEIKDFDEEALRQWEKENQVPFQEQKEERYIVRTFSESTELRQAVCQTVRGLKYIGVHHANKIQPRLMLPMQSRTLLYLNSQKVLIAL